ncbi:MAG: hypothetical protein NT178_02180 [Proteobacteria bacterium]|nr:hypothetical protein [Pseudomonadota bacterium]
MKIAKSVYSIILFTICAVIFIANPLHADSISPNKPYSTSKNRKFIVEMRPKAPYGEEGNGIVKETATDRTLWKFDWYAPATILLNNGSDLIRFGPWVSDYQGLTDFVVVFL